MTTRLLRDLLDHPEDPARTAISHRSVAGTRAAAITAVIDIDDASPWFQGALGELQATVNAQRLTASGTPGGVYAADLFTNERGQATVFIPCTGQIRPAGRVEGVELPPAELAIIVHHGPDDNIDRSYGALGAHVTQHALAVEGPIREYYLCGRHDTPNESAWRTEIGWPIFQTST
jgi:effector-binding domain-containing protein